MIQKQKIITSIENKSIMLVTGIFIGIFSIWFSILLLKAKQDLDTIESDAIFLKQNYQLLELQKKQNKEKVLAISGDVATGSATSQ